MLHVRSVSDLHLEFHADLFMNGSHVDVSEKLNEFLPPLPTDKKTVLIVAGDLATARQTSRIVTFFSMVLPRFKHAVYVLGNHEHYGMYLENTLPIIEDALEARLDPKLFKKLTIAGNEPVKKIIGGVTFLLGTLWTDYGRHRTQLDVVRRAVSHCIADHRVIKASDLSIDRGFSCQDGEDIFNETVSKFGEWMEGTDNSKTVVVTHHLPSFQAVHPMYCQDESTRMVNHAFASNLDDFIMKHQPALWFFGHTHTSYYGKIGKTQLHCNPYGYPHESTAAYGKYDTTRIYTL